MFGELLAQSCLAHGIAGLVIDAGVRDTTELTALGFPVWSKAVRRRARRRRFAGSVNVPIVCAGAAVAPGDVIVGDADGVVVVPRVGSAIGRRRSRSAARERRAHTRARLKAGDFGLDIYGLRDVLAERGVVWRDE